MLQLISAGLQWFLDGVYISTPTTSTPSLSINVKLVDTANTPLATGSYTQVQVRHPPSTAVTVSCLCSALDSDLLPAGWLALPASYFIGAELDDYQLRQQKEGSLACLLADNKTANCNMR